MHNLEFYINERVFVSERVYIKKIKIKRVVCVYVVLDGNYVERAVIHFHVVEMIIIRFIHISISRQQSTFPC